MRKKQGSYVGIMAIIMIVALIIDQLTKTIVLRSMQPGVPVYLIGDWFRFNLVFNPGAAFSMGTNMTWVFTIIQISFVLIISFSARKVEHPVQAVALALIAGGAAGNGADRLFREPGFFIGHVVDFISIGSFAIFNIADSCITIGVVLLMMYLMKPGEKVHG